jgi:hypothetical protein
MVGVAVAGSVVVSAVGVVGGAVGPLLATVGSPRRLDVVPSDQVSTALMVCDPLARFVVS